MPTRELQLTLRLRQATRREVMVVVGVVDGGLGLRDGPAGLLGPLEIDARQRISFRQQVVRLVEHSKDLVPRRRRSRHQLVGLRQHNLRFAKTLVCFGSVVVGAG